MFTTMMHDVYDFEQGNGLLLHAEDKVKKKELSSTSRLLVWVVISFVLMVALGSFAKHFDEAFLKRDRDDANSSPRNQDFSMHSPVTKKYSHSHRPINYSDDAEATATATNRPLRHFNSTVQQLRMNPPDLSEILDPSLEPVGIVGSVEWLLDFAIIGFPRCGTTYLEQWLNSSDSIYVDSFDVNGPSNDKPNKVIQHLYNVVQEYRGMEKIKAIGIRNPADLDNEQSLQYYRTFFGSAKLIIMLRHPVLWFQSYYNSRWRKYYYQAHNATKDDQEARRTSRNFLPPPQNLLGRCNVYIKEVCTDRAQFHHAMSLLGLTPMNTSAELALLNRTTTEHVVMEPTPQQVFLLEISQMDVSDSIGAETLRHELETFLQVDHIPAMPPYDSRYDRVEGEIDICGEEYAEVRQGLIQHGQQARQWMVEYLLQSNRVMVSSRQHFLEILETWTKDPCPGKG
jgi:Sulfotransferase domain